MIALVLAAVPAAGDVPGVAPGGVVSLPGSFRPAEVLERYFSAQQRQREMLRGASMDMSIEARLPRLNREGSLHAVRQITASGEITYDDTRTAGDKMVIKDVIARYLTAEAEASRGPVDARGISRPITINTDNYRFRHKAVLTVRGQRTYIFQLTPRAKRLGLFRGELWVDEQTGMPVRESGRLVKSPSVFLSRIDFVHEYDIRDGLAVPVRAESVIETRLVGRAELEIRFSGHSLLTAAPARICALGW